MKRIFSLLLLVLSLSQFSVTSCYPLRFTHLISEATDTLVTTLLGGSIGLCMGIGTYLALRYITNQSPKMVDKAIDLIDDGVYRLKKNNSPQIQSSDPTLQTLLNNPLDTLNNIYAVRREFNKVVKEKIVDTDLENLNPYEAMQLYKQIEQDFRKQCPVFLLGECTKEDVWDCFLNRTFKPQYRDYFEQKVVAALQEKLKSPSDKPVQYVSFGCGGLFQDLVILTKALMKNPHASLAIHVIDQFLVDICEMRRELGITSSITAHSTIDPRSILDQAVESARKMGNTKPDEKTLRKNLLIGSIIEECRLAQLVSYLQATFPHANITLHPHRLLPDYFKHIEDHKTPYADVISAVDIEDDMSYLRGGPYNYKKLCVHTLEHNPACTNIWLSKKDNHKRLGACIKSISLQPKAYAHKELFERDKQDAGIPIYSIIERIAILSRL